MLESRSGCGRLGFKTGFDGHAHKIGDIGGALASWTGVQWFNSLGESATIVTGLIFIACVLAFRRGIVGEIVARVRPLRA